MRERDGSRVVGVVRNMRHASLREHGQPTVFFAGRHHPTLYQTAVARTTVPPLTVMTALRSIVADLDRDMSIGEVRTMEEWVARSSTMTRLLVWLVTASRRSQPSSPPSVCTVCSQDG